MPNGWGGMDNEVSGQNETPSNDKVDQFEEQKERIRQDKRQFTQASLEQGGTIDLVKTVENTISMLSTHLHLGLLKMKLLCLMDGEAWMKSQ